MATTKTKVMEKIKTRKTARINKKARTRITTRTKPKSTSPGRSSPLEEDILLGYATYKEKPDYLIDPTSEAS